jgi:hypothetical protein
MSARNKTAKLVSAFLVIAASASISGTAQAETGWRWYDSAFSTSATPAPAARVAPVRRAKPVQISTTAPIPRPIQVSSTQNESCFWCNRRVYISGLSF